MFKSVTFAVAALAALVSANHDCPLDREVACVDDIREAYPYCEKAAQAKGKDLNADLQCIKYFHSI